jgi:hypothetical protein
MSLDQLIAEWGPPGLPQPDEHWEPRLKALPAIRDAIEKFLGGEWGVSQFRHRNDSLSKSESHWGFRGGGQMFFNMLLKAAEPGELEAALRAAIPAPATAADARAKLESFIAFVEATKIRAKTVGATPPTTGHVPYFLSFFWESENREEWPIYYPASRKILAAYELFDETGSLIDRYMRYRDVIHQLRVVLETDTWGVESLLWELHQRSAAPPPPVDGATPTDQPPGPVAPTNIYSWYRTRSLIFPDEVITTFILSLLTKRFVILSGISGTGKTQIALEFARYLEAALHSPRTVERAPEDSDDAVHLKLTERRIARGYANLRKEQWGFFDVPDRGEARTFTVSLSNDRAETIRVNNIGFTDAAREMVRIHFSRPLRDWLAATAVPGDYVRLSLDDEGAPSAVFVVTVEPQTTSERAKRHVLIPVRSDWTDPRGLIGYFNPITHRYASTPFLDLLLDARDDPANPYIVILDEMNLARVEYYFSDFLSALESGESIVLKPADDLAEDDDDERAVPRELVIPSNVVFVGTVNVDETTHAISPKVLDRANVLEFNEVYLDRVLTDEAEPAPSNFRFSNPAIPASALIRSGDISSDVYGRARNLTAVTEALATVEDLLERYNRHFGYRVIREILQYVGHSVELVDGPEDDVSRTAFDLQLMQKVLPKLNGGRELEAPLTRLLDYCVNGERSNADTETVMKQASEAFAAVAMPASESSGSDDLAALAITPSYPRSSRKLLRMLERLRYTGFVSYLE